MRALAAAFLLLALPAAAEPPSVEELFQPARFFNMAISPDGKTIAALAPVGAHQNLVILNAETKKPTPITNFDDRDIVQARWISSKRMLVQTGSLGVSAFDYRGGALYAIDLDASEGRMISEGGVDEQSSAGLRFTGRQLIFVRTLPGEGDDIIAQEYVGGMDGRIQAGDLFRVNTRTGRRTSISFGKPDAGETEDWVVDKKGVARVQVAHDGGKQRIHYRSGPDAAWVKLDEFKEIGQGWTPLAVAEDDKTLIVSDGRNRDKAAIVRYDPATKTFGEVLAAHPQVDLTVLVRQQGEPFGVQYDADRYGVAWFDEELARVQSLLDKALPDAVNRFSWSRDRTRFLVLSYSDVSPGSFYLLDTKTKKMEWLVDRSPQIKPKLMAHMKPVRYAARDGLEIPAYLTLPPGSDGKNLPLVMMVHGGPWVDGDEWGFIPEVQFLAARGYAVLQPNFRGTTRYGWKHFSSGFGQWGLTMQDDVTDGVKWAVAQGIADPKRVCIYGASYGGYATMMGLVKDPDLYRCGVNYVGVTDINLFLTATWTDYAQRDFLKYNMDVLMGEATKDPAKAKAISPSEQARRIKAPVLMAYGAADYRVPIEHGQRMKAALEAAGQHPIWMVADGEAHGFGDMKNQKVFYEAMAKFLDENIGKPTK
jgi:dipeptidyl aminopeptidase/acylaminoacyl peptidase